MQPACFSVSVLLFFPFCGLKQQLSLVSSLFLSAFVICVPLSAAVLFYSPCAILTALCNVSLLGGGGGVSKECFHFFLSSTFLPHSVLFTIQSLSSSFCSFFPLDSFLPLPALSLLSVTGRSCQRFCIPAASGKGGGVSRKRVRAGSDVGMWQRQEAPS